MNQQLLSESLVNDKNFIKKQLRSIPKRFWAFLSYDEIESELNITIFNCSKNYDPKKGNIFGYIKYAFINNLNNTLRNKSFYLSIEVPLSAANNIPSKEENLELLELQAYIQSLPTPFVIELTEFILGKKNKEEIVSNPSFKKVDVDRVIEKLNKFIFWEEIAI